MNYTRSARQNYLPAASCRPSDDCQVKVCLLQIIYRHDIEDVAPIMRYEMDGLCPLYPSLKEALLKIAEMPYGPELLSYTYRTGVILVNTKKEEDFQKMSLVFLWKDNMENEIKRCVKMAEQNGVAVL
jgi:hypothetical protein